MTARPRLFLLPYFLVLAVAGCASTPSTAGPPAQPVTVPASTTTAAPTTAVSPGAESLVKWHAGDATITCPQTSTAVEVRKPFRSTIRRINDVEVVVLPTPDGRGAALVRAAQTTLKADDVVSDVKRLHELMAVPIRDGGTIHKVDVDWHMLRLEYEPGPEGTDVFAFIDRLSGGDGSICRVATLERLSGYREHPTSIFFDGESDVPGADWNRQPANPPAEVTGQIVQGAAALVVKLLTGIVTR